MKNMIGKKRQIVNTSGAWNVKDRTTGSDNSAKTREAKDDA